MKKLLLLITLLTLYIQNTHTQWVQQTVPVSKPIQGIKFINVNTGWACTGNTGSPNEGYVLNTTNGGTNWNIQLTSPSVSFNAICVINNIIYAGGSDGTGRLFKSTNGGTNWTDMGVLPSRVTDMVFLNQDSGYYCADFVGADVRTTTNGGLNWIVRINGIAAQTKRIFFLNYNTGFCGANSNLYKTTNAGVNWFQIANFVRDPSSIYFFNENTGWIGATISTFYKTTNAGLNWDTIALQPSIFGTITDLQFLSQTWAYAGNRTSRILVTTNGGLNWGYQTNLSASYKISFIDTTTGWIGDNGISKTTNGGGIIIPVGLQNISSTRPNQFMLYQNYPNPFNPTTKINFDVKQTGNVRLIVFDILGKTVNELIKKNLTAGKYEYFFEAESLPSGTYFYKIIIDNYSETKRMILIK